MPFVLIVLFAGLFSGSVLAGVYRHAEMGVAIVLPAGWAVRSVQAEQLVVWPPKREDRERGGVAVLIARQALRGKEPLSRLAARFRRTDGAREAAQSVNLDKRGGRLVLSYREGQYVQHGLWIVSQRLVVWQPVGKGRFVRAQCSANAAEFARYRRAFTDICMGMTLSAKGGVKS